MAIVKLADGTAHIIPADLRKALMSTLQTQDLWQSLTPLARNEWICSDGISQTAKDAG